MIQLLNNIMCDMVGDVFSNHAIMTDDGHGWFTQGKRSYPSPLVTDPVFYENEFNSIVEAKLMLLIDYCEIEHRQLSPGAIDTELEHREQFEQTLVADIKRRGKKPLGVSIHCDAWSDPNKPNEQNSAHGFCVYYYQKAGTHSVEGKKLARAVADSIIASDSDNDTVISPRHDNGISGANFFILRETDAPWILIENGFMTNDGDLAWLRNDNFRNARALAILDGLYNYVKS